MSTEKPTAAASQPTPDAAGAPSGKPGNGAQNGTPPAGTPAEGAPADGTAAPDADGSSPAEEKAEEARIPTAEEFARVTKELEQLKVENKDLFGRYHRGLADYDNLKRRSAKEVLEASAKGVEAFLKKFLSVLDTLDSANRMISEAAVDKKVKDGFEMLYFQITDLLEKEGLKGVPALGKPFDPNVHEAMGRANQADTEDGIIVQEYERGYAFKERIIRTAKVVINQK